MPLPILSARVSPILFGAACLLQVGGCAYLQGDDAALYASLTDQDVGLAAMQVQETLETAPDGATRDWINQESGHSGSITPTETYQTANGLFCRRYQEELRIGDDRGRFYHTACRQTEGRWDWL